MRCCMLVVVYTVHKYCIGHVCYNKKGGNTEGQISYLKPNHVL